MKKSILVLTIAFMLVSANIYAADVGKDQQIAVLIIYDDSSSSYLDIYQNYNQSLVANLQTEAISLNNLDKMDLSKYHMIYLDKSIIGKDTFNNSKNRIMEYVDKGGYLFVEDDFYKEFPLDFLGAESFEKVEAFPKNLKYPEVRENLSGIQTTLRSFHQSLIKFYDDDTLNGLDKGHGFVPSTSTPIAYSGNLALYGLNQVGEGYVLYANSLLPNHDFVTGFDMAKKHDNQEYFSFTFATGNYLFRNEFPALVSKDLYGYAAKKVLGPYGRPAMAWQNHFEVSSAVENKTMEKWINVLKEYDQTPSFSLARSLYEWGQWQESIILHTNIGDNQNFKFVGEEEDSHYSSGKHLLTGNEYVALSKYKDYKSLGAKIDLPYRAYPTVADLNGDGILDIVSGSQDGYLYLFLGKEEGEGTIYEDKVQLKDEKGNPIHLGNYSAPVLYDINKNGRQDIIVGNANGNVYLYINQGNLVFKRNKVLVENKDLKNLAPTIGDIDGDGTPDLIIGDAKGNLYFHKGKWVDNTLTFDKTGTILKSSKGNINVGTYAAPTFYDIDGDGRDELIVGNSTGYIKVYKIQFPNLIDKGFIEGETYNPNGNKRLWGGYYSVPEFADLNRDGKVDLLCGQVEFGLPTPIDSPLFPYQEELKQSIAYVKDNHLDIYPHVYFHKYKSKAQESKELELHQKAFKYYDIPWDNVGVNQHTWNVNNFSATQSFYSEIKQNINWNSGFRPNGKAGEPSLAKDYILSAPFMLSKGWNTEDYILFSPAPHIPLMEKAYEDITALDLPISYFYHIEYAANEEKGLQDLRYKAKVLDNIRNEKDYNFMTETQMFDIFKSIMKSDINIIKDPETDSYIIESNQDTVGIKFEVGEKLMDSSLSTDGDIYMKDGKDLYIGLNKKLRVYIDSKEEKPHIVRVNGPVNIEHEDNLSQVHLKGKGLQQIKLYAPKGLEVINKDFTIKNFGDYYILTRYGEPTTLQLRLY